jgi:hypothetical protein
MQICFCSSHPTPQRALSTIKVASHCNSFIIIQQLFVTSLTCLLFYLLVLPLYYAVVWITGASSGLGAELSVQLTALGAQVVMSARRIEKLNEVAEKCIGKHKPILLPLDVTDYNATATAYASVMDTCQQQLDIVVLNAGRSQRMSGEGRS